MRVLRKNDGALTNFEVLEFLRSRGATSDPMGCIGAVAASECKVYNYLIESPACNQTRKDIDEFLKRCGEFDLAKAEKLNIINVRPSYPPEIYPIIELCEDRFASDKVEELVKLVVSVLPPPPKSEGEMSNQEEADMEAGAEAGAGAEAE